MIFGYVLLVSLLTLLTLAFVVTVEEFEGKSAPAWVVRPILLAVLGLLVGIIGLGMVA